MNTHFVLPYQCIFMHKSFHLERNNHTICIFAVILIFLLPSDHVVEKMSVSHANENEIYILYFILLKITDYRFLKSYTSPASQQQHAPGNPIKVCKSVCKSQNVCPWAENYVWNKTRSKIKVGIFFNFNRYG